MKVHFSKLSSEYAHPLCKKEVLSCLKFIHDIDLRKIRVIKFGCNIKTAQEGRVVQHGDCYDIGINFCLKNLSSIILSNGDIYINQIKMFASCVDRIGGLINWKVHEAKRYALFLLFHEIGHIVYSESHLLIKMTGPASRIEEQWCDRYAMKMLDIVEDKIDMRIEYA